MRKPLKLSAGFQIFVVPLAWLVLISVLHFALNGEGRSENRVVMGYMPVVSNLAAPLVDLATKGDDPRFIALKFSSFSEMGEAFRSGHIQAAFIIAPLALMLSEQGVPLKIVYIGNRHESTLVMRSSLKCETASDLIGRTIAVPTRYSGHYLALKRYLRKSGVAPGDVRIVEIPPPEMPVSLAASEIDGYFVGEPFASKAIESGIGRRFLDVESVWPKFICNLLVVRQEMIDSRPDLVRKLVGTAAASGLWAVNHREEAIRIAADYWGQDIHIVRYAFMNPPERFRFDLYTPVPGELEEMAMEMRREGFLAAGMDPKIVEDRFALAAGEDRAVAFEALLSKTAPGRRSRSLTVQP